MTIYWNPVEDDTNPDTIEVWHVANDGTTNGPVTADVSDVTGMPDSQGGIAPDAVRQRTGQFIRDSVGLGTDTVELTELGGAVIADMLEITSEDNPPDIEARSI